MIKNIINYISIFKRKIKYKKSSYSFNGIDLIIDYIFKNQKLGTYIDVGAQHPISNNNTYLLHKRGWSGVNIDLDKKNIDLFNLSRPKDINLNYAISDKEGEVEFYFYHNTSPINTLSKEVSDYQKAKIKEKKMIKTYSLNDILEKINFHKNIDYMSIDVEGLEEKVLNGFNINKYNPKVVSIEFLDLTMNKLEFKNNSINRVLNSNIYKYFTDNNYFFVNWIHGDLIFSHKNFRD
jgi:FkbM family methyltransferase